MYQALKFDFVLIAVSFDVRSFRDTKNKFQGKPQTSRNLRQGSEISLSLCLSCDKSNT